MSYDPLPPWRRDFDTARDPYTARNALGIPETTGGPPAPASAEYVTSSADATLTNERVLTNTATVTWDFSTPGQAKANAATGGGGTPGGSNTQVQYNNSGAFGGSAKFTWADATTTLTIGVVGTAPADTGKIALKGGTSGTVTITTAASAGTYNFILPITAGNNGQALISGGGGTTQMQFTTLGVTGGGTGLSATSQGDLPYAQGTNLLTLLPKNVNATRYLSNTGLNNNPAWALVDLSNGVTGNLPIGNVSGAQPLDATLTALAAYNTNGLLTQTAADTFTGRTLTGPAAGITVSNGNGVSGNPTLALANDLAALEGLTGTNTIYYRNGVDNWGAVTIGSGLAFGSGTLSATATAPTDEYHHGQLRYSSATALQFKPFNGNKIKVNGTIYTIPNSGMTGLGNTGVYVDNVAGQNLAANTTYWVFAYIVGGVPVGHFYTVAGGLAAPYHTPSTQSGNEGVEVWYNGTELNQFTLIGMCRTNASSQFVDTTAVRGVLSWFNRRPRIAQGKFTADRTTASTSLVEINSEIAVGFLTWAEASVMLGTAGSTYNAGTTATGQSRIYLDGAALDGGSNASGAAGIAASIGFTAACGGLTAVTEGYHTATLYGATSAGTQTWFGTGNAVCTLTAQISG